MTTAESVRVSVGYDPMIFRVEPNQIWVVAVFDGRRNLEELLFERVRRSR